MQTHLLDASYVVSKTVELAGYAYLMDFEDAPLLSNSTFGLRLTGGVPLGEGLQLNYVAEFAAQQDYADNPVGYDANYYVVEAGLGWSMFGVKLGYEVLEGSTTPGRFFRTPLATLHKFQGWADKFLTTPTGGIENTYVALTAKRWGGKYALIYHDFGVQTGSGDHGDEIDFSAKWPFAKYYSVLLKGAFYNASNHATDTTRIWIQLTADF